MRKPFLFPHSITYPLLVVLFLAILSTIAPGILLPFVGPGSADQYHSLVSVVVDTALADGRDSVEFEVVLVRIGGGLVSDQTVYCASSRGRNTDFFSIGQNIDGEILVSASSSQPGMSQIAVSLQSPQAAFDYLQGNLSYDEAQIIQTQDGRDTFPVYFISGGLDIDACEMEFDKDTIAVNDGRYNDNAIGTIYLRTIIDQPVANQRISVYSRAKGIELYPTISVPGVIERGSSISLVTNREGTVSFVVRGYEIGDAEIICNVDGEEFSEFIYVDRAENVFDFDDSFWDDEDEDEEDEELVLSRERTKVNLSKTIAYAYDRSAQYGLPATADSWDRIILGGIAMSEDDQPIREQQLVRAYVSSGELDKSTTLTTSNGGAFSFSIASRLPVMGRYAVGLGTEEQLKAYLEGRISADACQLLGTGMFAFIDYEWDQYLICAIGETKAIINGLTVDLDVAPFVQADRTMLSARPIADAIGAVPNWNQSTQTASFYLPRWNYTVTMQVGSLMINRTENYVAPKQYTSDVPAMIVDGRTVLPLRALAEAFDMRSEYSPAQQLVAIYNTRINHYDPRQDKDSPLYDPMMDPESEEYKAYYGDGGLQIGIVQ